MSPSSLTLRQVTDAASIFLQENHPDSDLPIPIEEIVEIKLGIALQVIPGIKQLLGIDAFINHDFTGITIDEVAFTRYTNRTRFSIAHEIGHMVLHRDWYELHGPKTIEEAQTFQDSIDSKAYYYMERQANTFAGLILVPSKLLLREVKDIVGNNTPVSPFSTPIEILSERFCVSEEVILIRMQNDKIITQMNGSY